MKLQLGSIVFESCFVDHGELLICLSANYPLETWFELMVGMYTAKISFSPFCMLCDQSSTPEKLQNYECAALHMEVSSEVAFLRQQHSDSHLWIRWSLCGPFQEQTDLEHGLVWVPNWTTDCSVHFCLAGPGRDTVITEKEDMQHVDLVTAIGNQTAVLELLSDTLQWDCEDTRELHRAGGEIIWCLLWGVYQYLRLWLAILVSLIHNSNSATKSDFNVVSLTLWSTRMCNILVCLLLRVNEFKSISNPCSSSFSK